MVDEIVNPQEGLLYVVYLASLDVTSCFQNAMIPPDNRIWVSLPPRYMQWFKKPYPDVELENSESNSYAVQTMTGMQGERCGQRLVYSVKR